jgi:multidrug efflux pump subunit AcrA (membrane-fusion protein)
MYKADDLTEETEEIVLKRQRDAVERQTFSVELVKIDHERTMTVDLPRRDETTREAAQRQALALDKTKATLPLTLSKMRLDVEKLKYDLAKGADRLKKLRGDREMMAMKSPADGILYWGKCARGNWPRPDNIEQAIGHGGALKTNEVLMTIVKPRPICVRASIAERDLEYLRPGVDGQAVPTAYPDLKLPARLDRVTSVPASAESFDAKITLRVEKEAAAVVPGMACRVKLVPYAKKDAITMPPAAVFTDEEDEDRPYVYVSKKDAKPEKRPVAVGKKTDKAVEITEGLKEGDVVLLEKPEE